MGSVFTLLESTKPPNKKISTIQDLTKEEAKILEAAKQQTLDIMLDALKKKDKVLMKVPQRVFLKGEEKESFWMQRHAILTEDTVQKLIAELKKVTFKKNIRKPFTYAYIEQTNENKIIYLCDMFWKAPEYLEKDSQPGTLIHELSHFLGTTDLTYKESTLYVACKGILVKGSSLNPLPPEEDYWEKALGNAFLNANSIAHEFELILNHRGSYVDGKYSCCGETKRHSVCESSVPDYFHTCTSDEMWETEILLKELHQRSEAIAHKLKEFHNNMEEVCESLREAKAKPTRGALTKIVLMTYTLVLSSFKLSALLETESRLTMKEVTRVSTIISAAREFTKNNELYPILDECQRFLDIQRLLKFLDGNELFADSWQEYEFFNLLINIIDLIILEKELKS
ncbi:uncharacterized protein [Anolis sagrei]|uniref:uncharacterized protein n=1 Tax=Anolis sagrei TaxID=38937 RepID=UPI00352115F8